MKNPHLKYNSFNELLKKKFGTKIYRVTLHAGFVCPNRDGTCGTGGCIFCHDDNLLGKSWHKQQPLKEQIKYGLNYIRERHNTTKCLAYFQNGTNTYGNIKTLKNNFETVLAFNDIVGLVIGTRADCLNDDVINLLSEINKKTYLWVDVGLQSPFDKTLKNINRGHLFCDYEKAIHKLASHNILSCCHIILGLPGESLDKSLEGVSLINNLPINGIKIHNLVVTKNTKLANLYKEKKYTPLKLHDYAKTCVDYVERLRPDIIIHRLNAHAPARLTLAPKWSVNKLSTLNAVHQEMAIRKSFQSKFFNG